MGVLLYISKAFDKFWHKGLILKLSGIVYRFQNLYFKLTLKNSNSR